MEIEVKFNLPDAETFHRLQAVESLAGLALAAQQIKQVHDTYLDTPARAILSAGYACRRREQGDEMLITVKQLGGAQGALHRREELEVTLPADQAPAAWPDSPARDKVLAIIGAQSLAPLFDLHQTRTVRTIARDGQPVAELSLDDVHVKVGEHEHIYQELEVELKPGGTEQELTALADCLQNEWGLRPEASSKFERALALIDAQPMCLLDEHERAVCERLAALQSTYGRRARVLLARDAGASPAEASQRAGLSARQARYWLHAFRQKRLDIFPARVLASEPAQLATVEAVAPVEPPKLPEKPGLDADDSMAEAARKTLYFHFQRMLAHEPGTRLGEDIDELHDMRVATRRMRAALNVFGDYVEPDAIAPFAKDLRRTGRVLGAVRDLDVFRDKAQRYLDLLPAERQSELDPLLAVWQAERDRARAQMIKYFDSKRYTRFKTKFGAFLQTPGAGARPIVSPEGEPLPHRVRHVVPLALYQGLSAVRAFDEWLSPDVPLVRYHQLRIAFKGLRYTLEFFAEVLGPGAKPLINQVKRLQDHLGDLQDAVVACNVLRDFLSWGTWGHSTDEATAPSEAVIAPGVAMFLSARQTEIQELVNRFPPVWAPIRDAEFNRQLAALAAEL